MERKEFEQLAPSLRERIVSTVTRTFKMCGPDFADDVAQDTLLRLWTMRHKLSEVNNLPGLAAIIARNRALDLLREDARFATADLQEFEFIADTVTPYDEFIGAESAQRLDDIMASLPTTYQAVLRMRHEDELEISEIAAIINTSPGNIRVILSRARSQIKDLFLNS